ncbi:flagellin [Halocynthiibacter namhaensis]|uniref:flagellin n=1 Tax=Halocynthiibacter namhaensis TaxID=1290553 RepID=UPI000578F8A3|nr:flagellin [Halocynthiibacter namhaensis]
MPNFLSVGDLSQSFLMNRNNTALKTKLNQLSLELTTGKVQDVAAHLRGDFSPVTSIDRTLTTLAAYKTSNTEAALLTTNMQDSLEAVQGYVSEAGPNLIMAGESGNFQMLKPAAGDAKQKFDAVISTLNTQTAGRSLFSGTATDRTPLAPSATILNALNVAVAGETTAAGVQAVVDTWFAPGGGFDAVAYKGSVNNIAPLRIGANETSSLTVRADDGAFRESLKGLAVASLVSDGALSGSVSEQADLLSYAGEVLLTAESAVLDIRSNVGVIEAQIEQASVRNTTETNVLTIARAGLLEADPYKTATELQAAQTQLETLYTLTARLSQLSLSRYI